MHSPVKHLKCTPQADVHSPSHVINARRGGRHFPRAKKYHICRRQMSIPPLHSWRGGGRQAGGEVKGGRQAGGEVQRPRVGIQNLFRFLELELVQ